MRLHMATPIAALICVAGLLVAGCSAASNPPDAQSEAASTTPSSSTSECDPGTANSGPNDSCDPATEQPPEPTSTTEANCASQLSLRLDVPTDRYSNGTETDGALDFTLTITNNGASSCSVPTNAIVLNVTGPTNNSCTPQVQRPEIAPSKSIAIASTSGMWGTCVSRGVKAQGEYTMQAAILVDGEKVVESDSGSFTA